MSPSAALARKATPAGPPAAPAWPAFGLAVDIRPALARALADGRRGALATVIAATGGGPRGLGAQMFIDAEGQASGYLAGGCIEADVVAHALSAMAQDAPRRLTYGVGGPLDLPLPCGGCIEVLVEPLEPDDPAARALASSWSDRRAWLWSSDGRERWCAPFEPSGPAEAELVLGAKRMLRVHDPRLRLVLVGGEPTVLALAAMATAAGMEVVVVRPRGPAEPPPVAGVRYLNQPLGAALEAAGLDAWTGLVAATHDGEIDAQAAARALGSGAFFVGAIGSRRRATRTREWLLALGVDPEAAGRLRMPAGLPIGGRGPAQIAVSVLAELMSADHRTRAARRLAAANG